MTFVLLELTTGEHLLATGVGAVLGVVAFIMLDKIFPARPFQ